MDPEATKACGGPLTNEILPQAFREKPRIEREGFQGLLESFGRDLPSTEPSGLAKNRGF